MTKSKKEKLKRRILDSISEKATLSTNSGQLENSQFIKPTKKQRRHSGWRTPQIVSPTMKFSEMVKNALEPSIFYDDWVDFRDGFRCNLDKTHFFKKWRACCFDEEEVFKINKKIKKQKAIRKARKNGRDKRKNN